MEKGQKRAKKYFCEKCDYSTFKLDHYNRHLSTLKHKTACAEIISGEKGQKGAKIENKYVCEFCDRNFQTNSGLWKHKKICQEIEEKQKKG